MFIYIYIYICLYYNNYIIKIIYNNRDIKLISM